MWKVSKGFKNIKFDFAIWSKVKEHQINLYKFQKFSPNLTNY